MYLSMYLCIFVCIQCDYIKLSFSTIDNAPVGEDVGLEDGEAVGLPVGAFVGEAVGLDVGALVGDDVGLHVGLPMDVRPENKYHYFNQG